MPRPFNCTPFFRMSASKLDALQISIIGKAMLLKITSKRQVTFPRKVMEKFHLRAGDTLSVSETDGGIVIKPHRFDVSRLAPLKTKIPSDLPAPDFDAIRHAALDPDLRS